MIAIDNLNENKRMSKANNTLTYFWEFWENEIGDCVKACPLAQLRYEDSIKKHPKLETWDDIEEQLLCIQQHLKNLLEVTKRKIMEEDLNSFATMIENTPDNDTRTYENQNSTC